MKQFINAGPHAFTKARARAPYYHMTRTDETLCGVEVGRRWWTRRGIMLPAEVVCAKCLEAFENE